MNLRSHLKQRANYVAITKLKYLTKFNHYS